MKTEIKILSIIMILFFFSIIIYANIIFANANQPQWPTSWILIEKDPLENAEKDYRDVRNASYSRDNNYLYFNLECEGAPDFSAHPDDSRYKWFIDINDPYDMYWSGGNVVNAEYLLFIENTDDDDDGEIYLLCDLDNESFDKWESPPDYWYDGIITDTSIANYTIFDKNLSLWIKLENISNPAYSYFTWATDQENKNLDSSPNQDRSNVFKADLSKADLSVAKYADKDTVAPGESLTYTLNVTNHGPHNSTNVNINVTDVLPAEVSFVSAVATPVPTSNGSNGYTYWWTYSNLTRGNENSIIITINVTVNSGASGTVINNASVYNDTYDPIPDNNEYSNITTIATMVNLSIDIDGNGSVVKYPDQTKYILGTTVELTAAADPGWTFNHWSGDLSGSTNPKNITMDDNKTVTAHFTQDEYNLTVNTVGNGTVTIEPEQNNYTYGNIINLTAVADPGWTFSHWSGDLNSTNSSESIFINSSKNVTAYFTQDNYTLTITIVGSGSVSRNPDQNNYTYGANVEITANPSSGWYFDYWSGGLTGNDNPATINMTSDKYITAHFAESGGGYYTPPPPNGDGGDSNPTADANGPYYGFRGEEIQFNGSKSHDNDEGGLLIERYDWKFYDDGDWHNDSGATPTYIYNSPGVYNVTLRVYDDEGSSDENVTIVFISQPNRPPQNLNIVGVVKGHQNTTYYYNVSAIDLDDDNITYTINWGDGTSNVSNYLSNGTIYKVGHMWTSYGIYTITVFARDELNATAEENITFDVLIDIHYVKDIGYLIDIDSDNVYDTFYSNITQKVTITEQLDDGKYLINSDEDDDWDWIYDPEDDTLIPYPDDKMGSTENNWLWLLLLILLIFLIALMFLLINKKRKKDEPKQSKKNGRKKIPQ